MLSGLMLTSTMATEFDFPRLTEIHEHLPGLGDEGFEAYKKAICEDMQSPAQKPQATLAFVQSILDEEVPVRNMANAKTTMVVGAEEVGSYLQGLRLDYQPWHDLMHVICPPR
jgi:hypothetical protein